MIALLIFISTLASANEAVREYEYAHQRWVNSSLRSFIHRDLSGKTYESGANLSDFDEWDDPNVYEAEIEAAAEKMIRLELDVCEKYGLSPHQVWEPIMHANGSDEHRLGPRAAPFDRAYVKDVIARVDQISHSYAYIMERHTLSDWEQRQTWQKPGETVDEWRHRFWYESQLYDHRSYEDQEKVHWFTRAMLGRDPTEKLVALEQKLAQRYSMTDEELWEGIEYLVHSWKKDPWSSLHRPRRHAPPLPAFEKDLIKGVSKINRLAGQRLVGHLEHHEDVHQKYQLDEDASTAAAEAAAITLEADPRKSTIPDYLLERFEERLATMRARKNPYVPGTIDPKVAEELGERLLKARARGLANCNARLTEI